MKKAHMLMAVLSVSAMFCNGCQSTRALHPERDTSLPFDLGQEERTVLYYAALAPNAHNSQPWRLRYRQDTETFTLFFDQARALPHTDPAHRESYISLGAFLENFQQAATALGFHTAMEVMAAPSAGEEIARIRLIRREPAPDAAARLARMERRHTDKRPYADTPIPQAAVADLLKRHTPYLTYYAKGSPGYLYLADKAVQAMRVQSDNRNKRDELAAWLRFSDKEALAARDGLPAEQLGLTGLKKFFYYLLYDREKARGDAFARESAAQTAEQVAHCAGFFVITGGDAPPDHIRAGMNLEAFWLDAVAAGISIHPLSQMLEEEPYASALRNDLGLALPPQMILRAGIAAPYGKNHGIRRHIADFVAQEE